jgi:hypothetical protein
MNLTLHVWRQKDAQHSGRFVSYSAIEISPEMSFLEMLDVVNEGLIAKGEDPIAFDHDCREGICGQCGVVINGHPHGPRLRTTSCQLHVRSFKDGDILTLEPFRAEAFPVVKDLIVDRSAFDRIIAAGGYVSASIGGAPDANSLPVAKQNAELAIALDAARASRLAPTRRRCFSPPPRSLIWRSSPKGSQSATSGSVGWSRRWTPSVSAVARITANARLSAPRVSASETLPD